MWISLPRFLYCESRGSLPEEAAKEDVWLSKSLYCSVICSYLHYESWSVTLQ